MVELLNLLGLIGILSALGMYGLAQYVRHEKTVEAVGSVTAIAKSAAAYYESSDAMQPAGSKPEAIRAMRHFPPGASKTVPADVEDVRGKRYESTMADWAGSPWRELRFSIPQPQFYAYGFESEGAGQSAKASATARGDLDGDGEGSLYRLRVEATPSFAAQVGAEIEKVNPHE